MDNTDSSTTVATPIAETDDGFPVPIELGPEESRAFIDEKARRLLGMSAAEFAQRWKAGEWAGVADDPEYRDVLYLYMIGASDF